MRTFTIEPRGPFDLATARDFAGGFAAGIGSRAATDGSILMMFPVEGWAASAVVQVRQDAEGTIHGDVFGDGDLETIERQAALRSRSTTTARAGPTSERATRLSAGSRSGSGSFDLSASSRPMRRPRRS